MACHGVTKFISLLVSCATSSWTVAWDIDCKERFPVSEHAGCLYISLWDIDCKEPFPVSEHMGCLYVSLCILLNS